MDTQVEKENSTACDSLKTDKQDAIFRDLNFQYSSTENNNNDVDPSFDKNHEDDYCLSDKNHENDHRSSDKNPENDDCSSDNKWKNKSDEDLSALRSEIDHNTKKLNKDLSDLRCKLGYDIVRLDGDLSNLRYNINSDCRVENLRKCSCLILFYVIILTFMIIVVSCGGSSRFYLDKNFNDELYPGHIPIDKKCINLGHDFNQILRKGVIHSCVTTLVLSTLYNHTLDPHAIPNSLDTLVLPAGYAHKLSCDKFSQIKHIYISHLDVDTHHFETCRDYYVYDTKNRRFKFDKAPTGFIIDGAVSAPGCFDGLLNAIHLKPIKKSVHNQEIEQLREEINSLKNILGLKNRLAEQNEVNMNKKYSQDIISTPNSENKKNQDNKKIPEQVYYHLV